MSKAMKVESFSEGLTERWNEPGPSVQDGNIYFGESKKHFDMHHIYRVFRVLLGPNGGTKNSNTDTKGMLVEATKEG
jgi:hypothetical protein